MPKLKLTSSAVKAVQCPLSGQVIYFDTKLSGFGLRVGMTTKTYFAEKRVSGKTRRVTIGHHDLFTCEQARGQALGLLSKMTTGCDPNAEKVSAKIKGLTLSQVFEEFLLMRDLRDHTAYVYRRTMKVAFPDWSNRPLEKITGDMVLKRFKELTEKRGAGYANLAMRILRSVWNFARGRYTDTTGSTVVPQNPVRRLSETKIWNKLKRRQTLIKRSQLPAWYEAVTGLNSNRRPDAAAIARDYLLLLVLTGLRRQEAASLKWEHVDFDERSFTVPQTKNGEPLSLPMSDQLLELFKCRRARATNECVFPGPGATGHIVDARKFLGQVRENSGVNFTHHDLRRTFLTIAESLDVPHYALKRLVNHKMNGDVTAGYIVPDVERLRGPMQRISDHIIKVCHQEQKGHCN